MEEYYLTPAIIVPSGKQFQVFGGEDLIATCPTIEEANFYSEIWMLHQVEFRKILKKTFYKSVDSNNRMCPMYILEDEIGTTGSFTVFWKCREIDANGDITYPIYSEQEIQSDFTAITFPKSGE